MESKSFPSNFDIAGRYAKHREEYYLCYGERGKTGNYSIRPIIFSLNKPQPQNNEERFINGQFILDFIWECLRPDIQRESCSGIYNLNNWGHSLLPIILYFKNPKKLSIGDIDDFYNHFGI